MIPNAEHLSNRRTLCKTLQVPDSELVLIQNPDYVYAPYELVPLAAKITARRDRLAAVVQDMDGTTTSTENLCLFSLEQMVRYITDRLHKDRWSGLDAERDYPHIIGNSTTKHVEYLIRTFRQAISPACFNAAFLRAALQTLATGKDERRKQEVRANLDHFGCTDLPAQPPCQAWLSENRTAAEAPLPLQVQKLLDQYARRIDITRFNDQVRAAVDIYYQVYHEILAKIDRQEFDQVRRLTGLPADNLIEPMPGIAAYMSLVKGALGEHLGGFYDALKSYLLQQPQLFYSEAELEQHKRYLPLIGRYFQRFPVKMAVVTSSIAYEANIVLKQVFREIQKKVLRPPFPKTEREKLFRAFSSYQDFFDQVVTASDSSELRLKPHRDLYSLALFRLGIDKSEFDHVLGLEDSESGTISIRAAGVGLCVAVPFAQTFGHKLDHASVILPGGIPEAILVHHLFLSDQALGIE